MDDLKDAADDHARPWIEFARRFLEADSYRYGARVADALGVHGASAVAMALRRLSSRLSARDAFACVEASDILCGEVEEMESLRAVS
ncbi:MAG: hypothetical protein FD124_1630 [Alphaproteobacteria bacterium]|nr:MAG: hypothetical protein FD160_1517 [Caulobacteraceae bacterium]TPW06630.1 MAG: hypothetical protein FD124_1630 [Alphaproteobacteria bacterium]